MAKLQGLSNMHQLWRHNKPSVLKIDSFLKSTHQNTPVCQILPFYSDKQQSYKAFHISYYDVIEA